MVKWYFTNMEGIQCLTRMLIDVSRPCKNCNLMKDEIFFN